MEVKIHVPGAYLANSSIIKGVPLYVSDEQLLGLKLDQDVARARRRLRRRHHGPAGLAPTDGIILRFKVIVDKPTMINADWTKHQLQHFTERLPRRFEY